MNGIVIPTDELIITPDLNCILLLENKQEQSSPCIKCGKCTEVCPMNLIPSAIISNKEKAKELKINECINCGLCSYVCPSKIEIREIINKIKEDKHE